MEALLRANGCSVTGPRRAIVRALHGNPRHPTAAQLHAEVAGAWPGISRATVYNTLTLLAGLGVVRPLRQAGADTRFDPNIEAHHHRLCPKCGELADVPLEDIEVRWNGHAAAAEVKLAVVCAACG